MKDIDEEQLLQEVVDFKMSKLPPKDIVINRPTDKTDFKSVEEERKFQEEIDARLAASRPQVETITIESTPVDPETELVAKIAALQQQSEQLESKPFCDTCDSKGVRHKKACPKVTKN